MASDPKYVRLREGVDALADVMTSRWSITGLDVLEFPADDNKASTFVREKLRAGVLEPASKAEFEEVQEMHSESFKTKDGEFHQESEIRATAAANRAKIEKRRAKSKSEDDDEPVEASVSTTSTQGRTG
jgi:hypothetical protein